MAFRQSGRKPLSKFNDPFNSVEAQAEPEEEEEVFEEPEIISMEQLLKEWATEPYNLDPDTIDTIRNHPENIAREQIPDCIVEAVLSETKWKHMETLRYRFVRMLRPSDSGSWSASSATARRKCACSIRVR
jgi:hypothetical protein